VDIGFIFALLAMLSWGIGDFLIQRATRKIGDIAALGWIGIVGTLGLLPFVYKDLRVLIQPQNTSFLLVLGALTFIAAIFNFEALKRGKLAVIEVVLEIELPLTILLGIVFFHERLTLPQWLLISVIFCGVIMMALKPAVFKNFRFEKGVVFALITAIGMGAMNFLTASAAREISPLLAIWAPWFIFTVLCLVTLSYQGRVGSFLKEGARYPRLIFFMGFLDTAAWIFFAFATLDSHLGITAAITEGYPAVGVLLGVFIGKEHIRPSQWAGAMLAITGSIAVGLV
jgi:drug/metabolite transporter (DMT)-like permease